MENNRIKDFKLSIIPFSSLGNEKGLLLGFKPDYINVYFEDNVHIKNDIIIGIYTRKLSRANNYTSLIGLDILEEGEKNEFVKNS